MDKVATWIHRCITGAVWKFMKIARSRRVGLKSAPREINRPFVCAKRLELALSFCSDKQKRKSLRAFSIASMTTITENRTF